jgi:predicted nucleic acid-binding protein
MKKRPKRLILKISLPEKFNMVLDTDCVIRLITKDEGGKAQKVKTAMREAEYLLLTDVTFAEIFFVLKSNYSFERKEILKVLTGLVSTSNVVCNTEVLLKTIAILDTVASSSFVDAYEAAFSLVGNTGKVLSFDRDFDKIKGVKRIEP